jgi:triphosphatase
LLKNVPLEIENHSTAGRDSAPHHGEALPPVRARAPELVSGISAIEAFKTIANALLAQAQANRVGAIEDRDPEYLHQIRVAVRRLRALCGAYAKILPQAALQPFVAELKWLARALGPARDADVFITEIWPLLRTTLNANPLLPQLDARWAAQRHVATTKARRALMSRRYQRLMPEFERRLAADTWLTEASQEQLAVLDGPASDFARRVLERRDRKVRRHGQSITKLDDERLHVLRILIKKLRYAADSFGSLFGSAAADGMLDNLSRLQDILGSINDIHVAERHVDEALARRRGPAVTELRAALRLWCDARAKVLRRKLSKAWRAYHGTEKFW